MKILYVINGFDPGGAEHGLLTLLENGFFEGHSVKVLGLYRGRGDLAQKICSCVGVENFTISHDRETLSLKAMICGAGSLFRILRISKPDSVILSLKQANLVGRIVLALFPSIRCISFEHTAYYRARHFEWIYKYLIRLTSLRVDEVWADCNETLISTQGYMLGIRKHTRSIVPLFCIREESPEKGDYSRSSRIKLAVAGRLEKGKLFDVVVDAVAALRDKGLDVCLDIFGDGVEHAALLTQIQTKGLADRVQLLGYRSDWVKEVVRYDIFINASRVEGFCIVVAEAMAAGLPVVATRVGGINEYGLDGQNMLNVSVESVVDLLEKILLLADDEDLRRRIGSQACKDIRSRYSVAALRRAGAAVLTNK